MKVTRVAYTVIDDPAMVDVTDGVWIPEPGSKSSDALAEFAGRACYQSWTRSNEATRKNKDYLRSTVAEKGHESIMAHASVTYYITGVSRALTHELIRHRFLSFSELSQRYVDMEEADVIMPPALEPRQWERVRETIDWNRHVYEWLVEELQVNGVRRKQAREAARAVLPSAMETKIVVSGNIRAWRDFLRQRWSVHADAEIRELAGLILQDLRTVATNSLNDIPEEPYQ